MLHHVVLVWPSWCNIVALENVHYFGLLFGNAKRLQHDVHNNVAIRPVALEGEGSNCFSIAQLVGQKKQ